MKVIVTTVYDLAFDPTLSEVKAIAAAHTTASNVLKGAMNDNHCKGFVISMCDSHGKISGDYDSNSIFNKEYK